MCGIFHTWSQPLPPRSKVWKQRRDEWSFPLVLSWHWIVTIECYCVIFEENRTPLVVHEEEEWEDCDDEAADDEDHHHQPTVQVPLLPAHPPQLSRQRFNNCTFRSFYEALLLEKGEIEIKKEQKNLNVYNVEPVTGVCCEGGGMWASVPWEAGDCPLPHTSLSSPASSPPPQLGRWTGRGDKEIL